MISRVQTALKAALNSSLFRYGLLLAGVVFVADQIAKFVILGPMGFSPLGCLEGNYGCRFVEVSPIFDLRMVWNRGVSFGMLRADSGVGRWGLVLLSFVISGLFASWLMGAKRRLTAAALGLVVGGALGNVIDRIRFGAVCDFLDFNGLWFPWVFNVADAAISVGALLLVADFLLYGEDKAKTATVAPGAGEGGGAQPPPQN